MTQYAGRKDLRSIYQHARDLRYLGCKLGLEGNEEADREAQRCKASREGVGQPGETMIRLAAKRQVRERISARWKRQCDSTKVIRSTKCLAPGKALLRIPQSPIARSLYIP